MSEWNPHAVNGIILYGAEKAPTGTPVHLFWKDGSQSIRAISRPGYIVVNEEGILTRIEIRLENGNDLTWEHNAPGAHMRHGEFFTARVS